ncbi:MAG: tRNA (adenosine(37)-N6)-dimethylallyltransferase MiaA [Oscillospiraceae bacterium]|nr:tRNA (adenosine(37)-N6)-dimethylallyltransferase MiaA [Oscillospiraceae bacterium]
MQKNRIICIVGPTASGKTALSIALAKKLSGEIVSGDSMQIYKGMDIGTAKPDETERDGVVHHMLSVAEPSENYSAARYVKEAGACVDEILSCGKVPIVVGGTGLYIDSLVNGTEFAAHLEDEKYRRELWELYEEKGVEFLHDMLSRVDAARAEEIHKNNVKRVIRALEVYKITGKTISEHDEETKGKEPKYDATYIGLEFQNRDRLYERINLRVDKMIEAGLLREVENLLGSGLSPSSTAMQAIGYKELVAYFEGKEMLDEAIEKIKLNSRRYAKRQMTWFKRNEKVNWIAVDKSENISDIIQNSMNFISFDSI